MSGLPSPVPSASPEAAYLDAARACIVDVGWRRTTLTDIARRSGVSRMTIYRRWPDTEALLGDLLVREWTGLLVDSGLIAGPGTGLDRITDGVTTMVSALQSNDLLRRIIELDPELLHPYLFHRLGRNQSWMLELLERTISDGQADGSVRPGKSKPMARALLLACYGFVLSAPSSVDRTVTATTLRAELRTLIERYLAP